MAARSGPCLETRGEAGREVASRCTVRAWRCSRALLKGEGKAWTSEAVGTWRRGVPGLVTAARSPSEPAGADQTEGGEEGGYGQRLKILQESSWHTCIARISVGSSRLSGSPNFSRRFTRKQTNKNK